MIQGSEIAPGAWVLQNLETGRNMGVILGKGESGSGTTLVNPGHLKVEQDALEKFVGEMKGEVKRLLFTDEPDYAEIILWPNASLSTPTTAGDDPALPPPAPGWEMLELSPGTYLGLYNRKERILFCGRMLRHGLIPELRHGIQRYLDALDILEGLEARLVLPLSGLEARGKREIRTRIEHDKSYVMSVMRHVTTSHAAHLTIERVIQVATQIYEDYPLLETHLRNIRYAWGELT